MIPRACRALGTDFWRALTDFQGLRARVQRALLIWNTESCIQNIAILGQWKSDASFPLPYSGHFSKFTKTFIILFKVGIFQSFKDINQNFYGWKWQASLNVDFNWFSWWKVHGKQEIMKILALPTQNDWNANNHTQKNSITFDIVVVNIFKL